MEPTSSAIGFGVIVALYIFIGVLSAAGSVSLSKLFVKAPLEQTVFGALLALIAALYLAFTAHFGAADAWRIEGAAVVAFALVGLLGARYSSALVVGYVLHGLWDLMHELKLGPRAVTPVPLAYGYFCCTIDVLLAIYFIRRRNIWNSTPRE